MKHTIKISGSRILLTGSFSVCAEPMRCPSGCEIQETDTRAAEFYTANVNDAGTGISLLDKLETAVQDLLQGEQEDVRQTGSGYKTDTVSPLKSATSKTS